MPQAKPAGTACREQGRDTVEKERTNKHGEKRQNGEPSDRAHQVASKAPALLPADRSRRPLRHRRLNDTVVVRFHKARRKRPHAATQRCEIAPKTDPRSFAPPRQAHGQGVEEASCGKALVSRVFPLRSRARAGSVRQLRRRPRPTLTRVEALAQKRI
jgi:hypothetical protein